MRKLLVLSVLLQGAVWVAAQTSSSSPSSSPAQPSTSPGQSSTSSTPSSSSQSSTSQSTSSSSTSETKVEGCLSGSNGSYTLAAKDGTTYQLSGDTSKLSEHVGHDVQITGTTQASSSSGSSSSGASSGQTSAASQPTL